MEEAPVRLITIPRVLVIWGFLLGAGFAQPANNPRPVFGPGASKEEVLNAYGWPNGQSRSGAREVLSYAQGEVVLENGRVERVNFSPTVPWQMPRPRPAPATASTRKVPEAPVDLWKTNFAAAMQDAQARNSRVLILFTGSDWSPASRQFHEEVEAHPDFVTAFAGDFVFVRLDYPRGSPVPAKASDENLALRDRYGVTSYPTLFVLSPSGDPLAKVNLDAPSAPNESFRNRVIAAVKAARDFDQAPAPVAPPPTPAVEPKLPEPVAVPVTTLPPPGIWEAGRLIVAALLIGGALAVFIVWRMWRRTRMRPSLPVSSMAARIDAAAGGLPTLSEMNTWPQSRLVAIVTALAEADRYSAQRRASGEIDLELRKPGDLKPRVVVMCSPSSSGVVPTKRLRELFGHMAAEGVEQGWIVSPTGFSADAREYAGAHKIVLIGADGLHGMMREIPPVALPALLARV